MLARCLFIKNDLDLYNLKTFTILSHVLTKENLHFFKTYMYIIASIKKKWQILDFCTVATFLSCVWKKRAGLEWRLLLAFISLFFSVTVRKSRMLDWKMLTGHRALGSLSLGGETKQSSWNPRLTNLHAHTFRGVGNIKGKNKLCRRETWGHRLFFSAEKSWVLSRQQQTCVMN